MSQVTLLVCAPPPKDVLVNKSLEPISSPRVAVCLEDRISLGRTDNVKRKTGSNRDLDSKKHCASTPTSTIKDQAHMDPDMEGWDAQNASAAGAVEVRSNAQVEVVPTLEGVGPLPLPPLRRHGPHFGGSGAPPDRRQ
jgi:hypothetical protein